MNTNNVADLAWLAGIIDGEGSIYITKQSRKDRERQFNYILRMSVQSTDWIMADTCLKITQLGYVVDNVTHRENQSNCRNWRVDGRKAMKVLEAVLPFLRVKKDQAETAIEFQKTTKKHWQNMTEEDYKNQENFYYKLKQLKVDNKIGKESIGYRKANEIVKTESDTRTLHLPEKARKTNGQFSSLLGE